MAQVNVDALIPRQDFEVETTGEQATQKQSLQIADLEQAAFFYNALCKPDFQRETAEWDPKRVVGLIRSFIEGELIPAVILWRNRELVFVIDGSHRLSALIAWTNDDYGDGAKSQEFFGHMIPEEQLKVAMRTREFVELEFGSYKSHKDAISDPTQYGPDIAARAKRLGTLSLELQWVSGDAHKAEDSFVRINQRAAIITPQELELLKTRRNPTTIAARAIIRRGTGHKYWYSFEEKQQQKIEALATKLHKMIFEPSLKYPIKSLDLPPCGAMYSATALRMVWDFINLCVGVTSPEDDQEGIRTMECLKRCQRVMQLLLSNHPSSLGLHPAVYFYSWTGKQQPILFLTIAELIVGWERENKLPLFTELRARFETFLTENRSLLNQVIRKFGTKASGRDHVRAFYELDLKLLAEGKSPNDLIAELQQAIPYLQPAESPYQSSDPTKFSTQMKSGLVMKELVEQAPRCAICQGFVPMHAISLDHIKRREDGGLAVAENAQVTHPYCNTGYKEAQRAAPGARGHGAGGVEG